MRQDKTRTQRGRSRRGCGECKARHLKCDESNPECQNCLRRGIKCPGSETIIRWPGERPSHRQKSRADRSSHAAPTHDKAAERRMLGVDQTHTVAIDSEHHDESDSVKAGSVVRSLPQLAPRRSSTQTPGHDTSVSGAPHTQTLCEPNVSSRPCQSLIHTPTALVQYWFSDICPKWSTFDSPVNYNRMVAFQGWSASEALFLTLQTMSAAYLAPFTPSLRAQVPLLVGQASATISLATFELWSSEAPKVEAGLVLSMCGLGTSLRWLYSDLGRSWYEQARDLLNLWLLALTPSESLMYGYFDQALTYWKMLMCANDPNYANEDLALRRMERNSRLLSSTTAAPWASSQPRNDSTYGPEPHLALAGTRPSSWCGVSSQVIDVFGQVLALDRMAHQRSSGLLVSFQEDDATSDLQTARELQFELLSMDFEEMVAFDKGLGFQVETEDACTPMVHLLQTAEAFRLAALLHIYNTFDDVPISSSSDSDAICADRQHKIAGLALSLVSLLEKIPCDSGAQSIHPVLYLSAAIGLRSHTCPASLPSAFTTSAPSISMLDMQIGRSRSIISGRLGLLQYALPSRPIEQLKRFVCTLWSTYDDDMRGVPKSWLHVIDQFGHVTLFG